jgi:hypothetical protein
VSKWTLSRQALLGLAAAFLIPSATALASATNPYGGTGADVSYPQCGALPAQGPGSFAVIGATGGRAFTSNTCLASEVVWAQTHAASVTFYMNLNYPVGSTASKGASGKYGSCKRADKVCMALNYGDNAAADAVAKAQATGASTTGAWWIDIETANSWSADQTLNADVIQAALGYFNGRSLSAGIYSTSAMWKKIAGSYSPAVPNWVVSAAGANCNTPLFTAGSVWLVQQSSGTSGGNQACL